MQAKVEMLDNLLDIEVAYSLLRGGSDDSSKDPIDVNYEKLKTDIKVVDKDSEEAETIRKYVKNTHATTHNAYDLEVVDVRTSCPSIPFMTCQPFPAPCSSLADVQRSSLL
nr:PREDICTED: poly [ADP-ribose] polymerase 1-like [Equus przewalskii]